MNLTEVEREKYETVWQFDEYKEDESQGEKFVDAFFDLVVDYKTAWTAIDIGCGQGKAGVEIEKRGGRVWWLDLTDISLDPGVDRSRFIQEPIWGNWARKGTSYDYGYCCEMMEHIPPEFVALSIHRILSNCDKTLFTICNRFDTYGPLLLGGPLHLTVRPYQWWIQQFEELGYIEDARDLCGQSLFVVTR